MGVLDGKELEETIKVLEKPLEKRTKHELSVLINLTKDIPFFKEYRDQGQKEIHEQCVAHMQYEFIQEKEFVFEIGTIGDKFYLILNGKCGIHVKIGDPPALICVKVIEGGAGFGEVALMKNQPRLARIVCQTDCHLASLDKQSFIKILKQAEEDKLTKEMEFFAKMPMFIKWASHSLKLLYLNTYRVKCKKGEYLFKEGQVANAAYIVCQGEFTATKKFTQEIDGDEECLQKTKQDTLKFKNLQRDNSPTKDQRLVFWHPYELFGEEEFVQELEDIEKEEKCRREKAKREQLKAEHEQKEHSRKLQEQRELVKKEQSKKQQTNQKDAEKAGQNQQNEKKVSKKGQRFSKLQAIQEEENQEQQNNLELEPLVEFVRPKEYHRKYSVMCTSVTGEVCMIKKYDFIYRVLRDTLSRQVISERNNIKNGWFNHKVDDVNKLMSYSDYTTFYYTDIKFRNRIQGSLQENDTELLEFVSSVRQAFEQNDTLVRFQRKRNAKSEDVPHYSSKDIKKYEIPIHTFGNKSQNVQKMNVLEKDAMEEKAKKGIRQPPDIMDELVKKFHVSLKQNYYQRFKKDNYEQFSQMANHLEHEGLKSMIAKDDRSNPILNRQRSLADGLKKQTLQITEIATAKKFCKVMLKIRDKKKLLKEQTGSQQEICNTEQSEGINTDQQTIQSDELDLFSGVLTRNRDKKKKPNKISNNNNEGNQNESIYISEQNVYSTSNQTNAMNSPIRIETDIQDTEITDSPISPENQRVQRKKFFSVDSFHAIQESPQQENQQYKRVSKKLAKINNQIGQITRETNQAIYDFQQFVSNTEEKEGTTKNAQFFITNAVPRKSKSKSREPYKFELEKMKILQLVQPDINKSISSMIFDNKNTTTSTTADKSAVIHSSSSLPNKLASQRQKIKIVKRSNNHMINQSESDDSAQNLINKFGGENIQNTKQLQQQQQQVRQLSHLRNTKSYQSINNNIIFQSKQHYSYAPVTGSISIGPKQITTFNQLNSFQSVSTNTEATLQNETQQQSIQTQTLNQQQQQQQVQQLPQSQLVLQQPRHSQSPLKLQKVINSIQNQKSHQIQIVQSIN